MRTTLIFMCCFTGLGVSLLHSFLSNSTVFSNPVFAAMRQAFNPGITTNTNWVIQIFSYASNMVNIIWSLLQVLTMWSATVFAGDRIWIYYLLAVIGLVTAVSIILGFFSK